MAGRFKSISVEGMQENEQVRQGVKNSLVLI